MKWTKICKRKKKAKTFSTSNGLILNQKLKLTLLLMSQKHFHFVMLKKLFLH